MGHPASGYLYVRNADDPSREFVIRVDHIEVNQSNFDEIENADGVTQIGTIGFDMDDNEIRSAVFTQT